MPFAVVAELTSLYNYGRGCACGCGERMMPVALAGDKDVINDISRGDINSAIDALQKRYADGFDRAVMTSFGSGRSYPGLERDLRLSASRFGTYKAYDLSQKLDVLRKESPGDFKEHAQALMKAYNGTQRTEYNTLVARSRTAKQFKRFEEEADLYPNIEWLHTRSATPRETHLAFVGTILPQNHPFYQVNQPGNEWGCNCDWRTTDKPATAEPTIKVSPAKGLDGNPAETGELVTLEHPYFERNKTAPGWLDDKAILHMPDEVAFISRETTDGSYLEHLLTTNMHEAGENRAMAEILASNGYRDVKLLPQINISEERLRRRYLGADYTKTRPTKNPDFSVNGRLLEYKATNRRNLSKRIGDAALQADYVLIRVTEPMTEPEITRLIKGQWGLKDRDNLKEITLYVNGDLLAFERP